MSFVKNLFSKKRKNSDYVLALDIGTAFVKALVFKVDEEIQKGVVLGVGKVRQKVGNMNSGAVSDIAGVIEVCEQAIAQAESMAKVENVEQTIMGIAGEFVKGTTTTVHYERTRPEIRIDLPELKNIIQKVQWKAFDRIRRQLAWEVGHSEIDVKLINAAIVNVKIDGYRVSNPIGFQGREVIIGVFNAYAPMVHLGALQSIAEELNLKISSIVAEPYAVTQALGIEDDKKFGSIFVDIGGGTTDVALVRDGVLEGTVMFALGGKAFTTRLANDLEITFSDAENLKLKYSAGQLGRDVTIKIDKILEEDCRIWASGLEIVLESFLRSQTDLLPSRVLFCGGGSSLPGLYKALEVSGLFDNLPFAKKPAVGFIQPRDVVNIVDQTKFLRNPQDVTPMGLASLSLELADDKKILADALKQAVRVIQS
jgi:cell division protein FtsA